MKEKNWKVVANNGKRAELESGTEKTEIEKPAHINNREFTHWLAPNSLITESALLSLLKR
jgi:hypothetical protein